MDKSDEYIRMCAAADEIQQRWAHNYGDFFIDNRGKIRCWLSRDHEDKKFKKGFHVTVDRGVILLSRYVWLPRQNQLIEMAQIPGRRYETVTQDFFEWTKRPYETLDDIPAKLFRSMEKIWLAFVMQQKFNKQWDGERWLTRCHYSPGA